MRLLAFSTTYKCFLYPRLRSYGSSPRTKDRPTSSRCAWDFCRSFCCPSPFFELNGNNWHSRYCNRSVSFQSLAVNYNPIKVNSRELREMESDPFTFLRSVASGAMKSRNCLIEGGFFSIGQSKRMVMNENIWKEIEGARKQTRPIPKLETNESQK